MLLRSIWLAILLALRCVESAALPIASVESRHAHAGLTYQPSHYLHTEWSLLAEADAYGKAITRTTADSAKAITNNLRYPGQYWDAETGLHYNDRRYYDPETGRYLSSDPIGYEGGINLYAYAGAAPGRFIDPTGEFSLPNLSPPCMLINYGRCNLVCNAESALGDAFTNCGEVNWAQNAKDCLKSCLWSMLPIPDPCGMFGKLFSMAVGALGGNSFPGETLVHTKDRQGKPALKPIADIQIGDEVLAWDELAAHDGQEIQAKTGTSAQRISAKRYEKVSDLITSERERKLVHITLEGGKRITATDGHPFRTSEGWRDAVLLKKGAKLLLMGSGEGDGSDKATATVTATIEDVRIEVKTVRVYNLEVENLHTFFVGVQGVVVHNGRSGTSGENGPARTGRQQHENYRPEGFERPTLPSGKRPDGVNYDKKIVVELKPNNWRQYKRGCKQVQGYVDELNRIDGPGWRGFVTFY